MAGGIYSVERYVTLVVILAFLAGCGGTSTAGVTRKATVRSELLAQADDLRLGGFGALDADWNQDHRVDTSRPSGTAYEATDHSMGPYVGVLHRYEHVLRYTIDLSKAPVSSVEAKHVVALELPPDAVLLASRAYRECEHFVYRSRTVGIVLNTMLVPDPRGLVGISFQSRSDVYDPALVTSLTLQLADPDFVETDC